MQTTTRPATPAEAFRRALAQPWSPDPLAQRIRAAHQDERAARAAGALEDAARAQRRARFLACVACGADLEERTA